VSKKENDEISSYYKRVGGLLKKGGIGSGEKLQNFPPEPVDNVK
jgi:hypothetical protein